MFGHGSGAAAAGLGLARTAAEAPIIMHDVKITMLCRRFMLRSPKMRFNCVAAVDLRSPFVEWHTRPCDAHEIHASLHRAA